ncbi:MAG: DUF3105 domain-containing protein [Nitrospirota bacterium]
MNSRIVNRSLASGAAALAVAGSLAFTTSAAAKSATLAYVANGGNNNIQIVDVATGETVNKLYAGAAPWRLVPSPDKKRLLVQHWYSETTAVVNLATNEIEAVLPVRGPGTFAPDGKKFWSYSWPGSFLQSFDGKTFKPLDQRQTEDRNAYELIFWEKSRLVLGQYDPITKAGRKVSDFVMTADLSDPKHQSSQIATGTSPARIVVDPSGDFILTANVDGNDVTIANQYGATARITLAPGPRDILFADRGKRLIVICWKPGARESEVFTLSANFAERPWPAFKAEKSAKTPGGLTDAALSPDGRTLYALDRLGKRLVSFDAVTLEELGSLAVGDEPTAFVLREVSGRERDRLAQKTAARKRLEEVVTAMKTRGPAFTDVAFTETMTSEVPEEVKADGDASDAEKRAQAPKTKTVTSTIKTSLRLPDSVRQEFEDGGIRLAQGGRAYAVTKAGRYNSTPRQDLVYLLYTVQGQSTDEWIKALAGDVPGSLYLRNGIAVDIARTVEEEGHRYHAIGAMNAHDPVSQLWVSAETGLPVSLVEQFPVMRAKNPHAKGDEFQGLTETRLQYQKLDGGYTIPTTLSRYLDGKELGRVEVSQLAFNQNPPPERFDLARLGGAIKPLTVKATPAKASQKGPGLAVSGLGNAHVGTPFEDHAAYNSNPPTSGPHTPYVADWGVHKAPIAPETQVHNLEDGGVLVQYSCPSACPDLAGKLEALAGKYERLIVAPYPLMTDRIALTAWERVDLLTDYDEARITAFIDAYIGKDHHPAEGEGGAKPSGGKEKE